MAAHNKLGIDGEELAAGFLKNAGYTILDRNWHCGHKELDMVARCGDELVVVEVKTRGNTEFGKPEDAVSDRKIRRIVSAADAYVRKNCIDLHVRFDIITVIINESGHTVEHIEDAFFPPVWNR